MCVLGIYVGFDNGSRWGYFLYPPTPLWVHTATFTGPSDTQASPPDNLQTPTNRIASHLFCFFHIVHCLCACTLDVFLGARIVKATAKAKVRTHFDLDFCEVAHLSFQQFGHFLTGRV